MKAWLIYRRKDAEYNQQYIAMYREEGVKLGIEMEVIYVEDLTFGVEKDTWMMRYQGVVIQPPSFVICRIIYPLLSKQFEYMSIPVFNNAKVAQICNDKAQTYQYLARLQIPMVSSIFCKNEFLEDELKKSQRTQVVKAVDGHGGNQVVLWEPAHEDTSKLVNTMQNSDVVLQPLIGNAHQDLRVYVIGNEMIAAILRTAQGGFRSNYSLGGRVEIYHLSKEERILVRRIIDEFEFGLVGIDFLIGDKGALIFNEIEDVVGARMLYQCTNINLVARYLEYILSVLYQVKEDTFKK